MYRKKNIKRNSHNRKTNREKFLSNKREIWLFRCISSKKGGKYVISYLENNNEFKLVEEIEFNGIILYHYKININQDLYINQQTLSTTIKI